MHSYYYTHLQCFFFFIRLKQAHQNSILENTLRYTLLENIHIIGSLKNIQAYLDLQLQRLGSEGSQLGLNVLAARGQDIDLRSCLCRAKQCGCVVAHTNTHMLYKMIRFLQINGVFCVQE